MLEEYEEWFDSLADDVQDALYEDIILLETIGPTLSRPYVDTLYGSKFPNLKELRTDYKNRPYRSLFIFDPTRSAVLLAGGDKSAEKKWYRKNIAIAEKRYDNYLKKNKLK